MNSYQIRFIAKLVFTIFLLHICLVSAGIAHDDHDPCSSYEHQVEIELEDLENAQRTLKDLQDAGPISSIIEGYADGWIIGAIAGAVSYQNQLKDAEAAVEQAQQDYDAAVQNLEDCRNSSHSQSSATSS